MTKTLLVFPRAARTRLDCKWIETGNPNCPLVCVWVDQSTGTTTVVQEAEQMQDAEAGRRHLQMGHLCA